MLPPLHAWGTGQCTGGGNGLATTHVAPLALPQLEAVRHSPRVRYRLDLLLDEIAAGLAWATEHLFEPHPELFGPSEGNDWVRALEDALCSVLSPVSLHCWPHGAETPALQDGGGGGGGVGVRARWGG